MFKLCICVHKNQKDCGFSEKNPVSYDKSKGFCFIFAGYRSNIQKKFQKKEVADTRHFGHSGSTKMMAESSFLWWSRLRKDIQNKSSSRRAFISSFRSSFQLPSVKKYERPAVKKPGQEKNQINCYCSGILHIENVTTEHYTSILMHQFCKWPVNWISASKGGRNLQIARKLCQIKEKTGENIIRLGKCIKYPKKKHTFTKTGTLILPGVQPDYWPKLVRQNARYSLRKIRKVAKLDKTISFNKNTSQALGVLCLTIHTRKNIPIFESYHCLKPETELNNVIRANKSYFMIGGNWIFKLHQNKAQ